MSENVDPLRGERIKNRRQKLELSQTTVALALNLSRSSYIKIEAGSPIKPSMLEKLSSVLQAL